MKHHIVSTASISAEESKMPTPIDLKALGELISKLNPYSTVMEHPADMPPAVEGAAPPDPKIHFQIEVHDHYENYSSAEWSFRGQPQTIKKAVRVTYRYQLKDTGGNATGFYATEHLLIGYAGGNGGG
jgi:hypothetical protein